MRRIISFTIAVFFASVLSLTAFAQTAQFSGRVTDPQNKVVIGAEVRIFNQANGVERKVTTNGDGLYTAPFIQPGKYQVYVQAPGFSTVSSEPLTVTVGQALVFDVQLKVGSGSEVVTVNAGDLSIDTTDASVSTVVDRQFVENAPLNGRSFQDLISMTPGVSTQSPQSTTGVGNNGDFSVNGQRTESNYYTIDGVTGNTGSGNGLGYFGAATGGALGASTTLGTTQSLISVDALQEFRVESSTYSAEYGRSPGGQFSLVTRSGTNTFHGTLFDYLRNNFFDANDWFNDYYNVPQPALRQNDFGGTLGGPVKIPGLFDGVNRSFFFVSYEGMRLTLPQAATVQYVPDNFMRKQAQSVMQPILNAFPVQNGIDYGTSANPSLAQFIEGYTSPSNIDSTSLRIDETITPRLSVFFRYGDTPSSSSSRPQFALTNTQAGNQSFTFGATKQLAGTLTDELRLGYDRANSSSTATLDQFGGAVPINLGTQVGNAPMGTTLLSMYIGAIGSSSLGTGKSQGLSRQWNLVDTMSFSRGNHAMKFGVDYRRISSPTLPQSPLVEGLYFSPQSVLNNSADVAFIQLSDSVTPIFNETAVFAQDEWHVSPRLSISGGLRWEVNPPPVEANGNDAYTLLGNFSNPNSLTLAPQGTPLWRTTWLNFAPRLGAAYIFRSTPGWETVIRGGGGVFFDTDNQVATLGYSGVGFSAYEEDFGQSFPLAPSQLTFSTAATAPYSNENVYAFPTHLQLPYTLQWNVSVEQGIGSSQSLTLSYIAASGRRLLGQQDFYLGSLNSDFGYVYYIPSGLTSNYQSLQSKFQRTIKDGLQVLASYTWSHSIDFGSQATAVPYTRGNSDYDVRNNFQAGISWDMPRVKKNRFTSYVWNGWGLDGRISARTGFPITLEGNYLTDPTTGNEYYGNVDLIPGKPLYLYGSQYPGGRMLNGGPKTTDPAFVLPTNPSDPGDAPRNFVRGFGAAQFNIATRREVKLHDAISLQFRAEAFNVFNHPNFGYINPYLTQATFGQATKTLNQSLGTLISQYQQGGPRSMQFALKIVF